MKSRTLRYVNAAVAVLIAFGVLGLVVARSGNAEPSAALPIAQDDAPKAEGPLQKAVFAGGCFWGVNGVFQHVKGVRQVLSGYAGGQRSTAEYEIVSSGATGHAESVQVTYDPQIVSYGELLRIFFSVAHDPTQLNRQGPDFGTQYRSEIFYADDAQKKIATAYIAQLDAAHAFRHAIVTRVDPLRGFYVAEAYHQDYLVHNPRQPYIVFNDLPKIAALKRTFPEYYVEEPVLSKRE